MRAGHRQTATIRRGHDRRTLTIRWPIDMDIIENLPHLVQFLIVALGILLIAWGALDCFYGYRIFKIILGFQGLFVGGGLTLWFTHGFMAEYAPWVVLATLAGAAIGAFLFVLLYFIGVFILGAMVVAAAVWFGGAAAGVQVPLILVIIVAVAGGVVAAVFRRFVIVVCTALSGAEVIVVVFSLFAVGEGAFEIIENPHQTGSVVYLLFFVCWAVVASAGIIVQFEVTARKRDDAEAQDNKPQKVRSAGSSKGPKRR